MSSYLIKTINQNTFNQGFEDYEMNISFLSQKWDYGMQMLYLPFYKNQAILYLLPLYLQDLNGIMPTNDFHDEGYTNQDNNNHKTNKGNLNINTYF